MCRYFREEKVQSFSITGDRRMTVLQDGSVAACTIGSVEAFYSDMDGLVQKQVQSGTVKQQEFIHATNWASTLLPYAMGIIGFILIMNLMGRTGRCRRPWTEDGQIRPGPGADARRG